MRLPLRWGRLYIRSREPTGGRSRRKCRPEAPKPLRRAVRTRGHFPGDDAAMKLLYLVLNKAADEWKRPPREWSEAKTQFAVIFGERFVI